jgi:hypothetical protein
LDRGKEDKENVYGDDLTLIHATYLKGEKSIFLANWNPI